MKDYTQPPAWHICHLWVPLQISKAELVLLGKNPPQSQSSVETLWVIIHDTLWRRKPLYLWGLGPVIRRCMNEVFFLSSWLAEAQSAAISSSLARDFKASRNLKGWKKKSKNYVTQQVEHDRWQVIHPLPQPGCRSTFAGAVHFKFNVFGWDEKVLM